MTSVRWAWWSGLVAALVVTPAYSQHRESGDVYMGAALGYHLVPDSEDELQGDLNADPETRGVLASIDDGVIGWGVYGGFAVTDELALEAGYLGNADMGITLPDLRVESRECGTGRGRMSAASDAGCADGPSQSSRHESISESLRACFRPAGNQSGPNLHACAS